MNKYLIEFTTKRKSAPVRSFVVNFTDSSDAKGWIERQKNAFMVAWLKDSDLYDGQSPSTFKTDWTLLKKDGKKYIDPRNDSVVSTR
jgi:hypothetical protein